MSLSTITLRVDEIRRYQPADSPTLRTRIARVWSQSLNGLRLFGEGLLLIAVGAVPWLVVLAVGLIPVAIVVRQLVRRSREAGRPLA